MTITFVIGWVHSERLSAAGLRNMVTEADVRLTMVAVSLMFTIIFLSQTRGQAGKGQRAGACSKQAVEDGGGVDRE